MRHSAAATPQAHPNSVRCSRDCGQAFCKHDLKLNRISPPRGRVAQEIGLEDRSSTPERSCGDARFPFRVTFSIPLFSFEFLFFVALCANAPFWAPGSACLLACLVTIPPALRLTLLRWPRGRAPPRGGGIFPVLLKVHGTSAVDTLQTIIQDQCSTLAQGRKVQVQGLDFTSHAFVNRPAGCVAGRAPRPGYSGDCNSSGGVQSG